MKMKITKNFILHGVALLLVAGTMTFIKPAGWPLFLGIPLVLIVLETIILKWFLPKLCTLHTFLVTLIGNIVIVPLSIFAFMPVYYGALYSLYGRQNISELNAYVICFLIMCTVGVSTQLLIDRPILNQPFKKLCTPILIAKALTTPVFIKLISLLFSGR